ncbi:MAG: GTP 3',8-cyclase MoaA [Candidatus Latescibacteria bacterium]|jgi:GTP 3',8-cyclase|nr:GTP 3',8-cyclase MoaA [Candidatus Latescibacterota bacterium]
MAQQLIDGFGRAINNLRISVTDQCNFRCTYCMPEEGMIFMPRDEILTFEEITRFATIAARLGINKLRLTGGEPTLRKDLPVLVKMLADVPGIDDMAMTTNGFLLKKMARDLHEAGLPRVNVSIDTLDRQKFKDMTRRDALEKVLEGLEEAEKYFSLPIKINAVAIRDFTEEELVDFAALARTRNYQIRFIEFMPLDADRTWTRDQVLTGAEIVDKISAIWPLEPVRRPEQREPADLFRFKDGKGEIGLIASVSEPFCANCNRIRITAEGKLRTCLFSLNEIDIKALLRGTASDEEISHTIIDAVSKKEAGHQINDPDFIQPERTMSSIGG